MIVFVHLLNDRSGSPRVLCSALAALVKQADGSRLFVGSDGAGCLNEAGIAITRYWYRRTPYRLLTLFTYLFSQLCLLVRLLCAQDIKSDALIYVNTLLPFGAALYGRLTGRRVIYHLHEVSVSPALLRWFLTAIARRTASRLIYVSNFHQDCLSIPSVPARTVYNALDANFTARAQQSNYKQRHKGIFTVLMLASLRDYKGVPELLVLASQLLGQDDIHFEIVVNDDKNAIRCYFADKQLPSNVSVHPCTTDPAIYYAKASLVMNLSRPDQCVETFGLTLLEAMSFGIPVIAPPVGGPVELVDDGINGYLIDSRNIEELKRKIILLTENPGLCLQLSKAARDKAKLFSLEKFKKDIQDVINDSIFS
jgi:glycosyltransferase involved in cell wall biosynthesis